MQGTPILGNALHDLVDAKGKQEFGIEAGDTLKLKYIDPTPPQGFKQFHNQIFTCKACVYLKSLYWINALKWIKWLICDNLKHGVYALHHNRCTC